MEKYITAVDLGTHMIKAAIGEMTGNGIKVVAYSEFPSNGIENGDIKIAKRVTDVLRTTLEDLRECGKGDLTGAFFNLSSPNFKVITEKSIRKRKDPDKFITRYEVDSMLREMYNTNLEGRSKVIYVCPQYYHLDENLCLDDIEDRIGETIEANYKLCIGKKSSIDSIQFIAKNNNLILRKWFFSPIASAASTLTDEDKELGVVLVDIGAGTTDVLIYLDNVLKHAASIPFGGDSITHDIREECRISLKNAEQLKIRMGSCISDYIPENKIIRFDTGESVEKHIPYKLLVETIEARCLEIFATVNKEIQESGLFEDLKAGIVLTGGGANLAHLDVLANKITGMEVRVAVPSKDFITENSREEIFKTSSSTLAGLLIEGAEYTQNISGEDYYGQEEDLFGNPVENNLEEKQKTPEKPKKSRGGNIFTTIFNTDDNDV